MNKKTQTPSWFVETYSPTNQHMYGIKEVLFSSQSTFHKIDIVDTYDFGKCLILDGHVRVFELDEFIYHEGLTMPLIARMGSPGKFLLAGDGDGGAVRELLKSEKVTHLDWIDIDSAVVQACKTYLGITPHLLFEDSRLSEITGDVRSYLESTSNYYDAIILSVSEPVPGGPSEKLYTNQFYKLVASRLADDGLLAVQSGCSSLHCSQSFSDVVSTLRSVFQFVSPYQIGLPSFGLNWGFSLSSKTKLSEPKMVRTETNMYDLAIDKIMFEIPKYLSKKIDLGKILLD